jgi:hypothetical protein
VINARRFIVAGFKYGYGKLSQSDVDKLRDERLDPFALSGDIRAVYDGIRWIVVDHQSGGYHVIVLTTGSDYAISYYSGGGFHKDGYVVYIWRKGWIGDAVVRDVAATAVQICNIA